MTTPSTTLSLALVATALAITAPPAPATTPPLATGAGHAIVAGELRTFSFTARQQPDGAILGTAQIGGPPDSKYVRRMTTFHDFDPLALWGFLTSGTYVRCPPGRTLLAEGAPSTAYYLTINGAVEKVLVRDNRRIRVGLAGPGRCSATRASSTVAHLPSPRSPGSGLCFSSCRLTGLRSCSTRRTRSPAVSSM
jgi:hypothetical protein